MDPALKPSGAPELPAPTIWPAVLAAGITLLAMGLVTSLVFTLAGALVGALGLGGWIRELRHG
jgi:hypothetical protein